MDNIPITQAEIDRAEVALVAARTALVLEEPFFAMLVPRLTLVADVTCETGWTDGVHLGFNPRWVLAQTHDQRVFFTVHEVFHCANGHPWRRNGRDHRKWNEACDHVINPELRDAGYVPPDNVLMDDQWAGHFAEWVYDRLPDPEPDDSAPQAGEGEGEGDEGDGDAQGGGQDDDEAPGGAQGSQEGDDEGEGDGAGDDAQDGQDGAQDGDGDGQGSGGQGDDAQDGQGGAGGAQDGDAGDGDGSGDGDGQGDAQGAPQEPRRQPDTGGPGGEVRDAPTGTQDGASEPEAQEADWRRAVQEAAMVAQARGKLPGSFKRFAEAQAHAHGDWRSVLRRFAQEVGQADYSWRMPNAHYAHMGLYLPSLKAEGMGPMVVAIDTSGSVDAVALGKAEVETNGIVEEMQPEVIYVMYCDAALQHVDTFARGDYVTFAHHGGGGTDFRPVFEALADLDPRPVCVVYFTDLDGTFPEQEPDVPTLWIATPTMWCPNPKTDAPWGEVVEMID